MGKKLRAYFEEVKTGQPADLIFDYLQTRHYPFFLKSSLRQTRFGRYSFLGADPFCVLKSKGRRIDLQKNGRKYSYQGHPFRELKNILAAYRVTPGSYPVPFIGGGVGYLGYDLGHCLEKLPRTARDDLKFPDLFFAFYDRILAFDHHQNKTWLIQLGPNKSKIRSSREYFTRLFKNRPVTGTPGQPEQESGRGNRIWRDKTVRLPELASNFTRNNYLKTIRQAKKYIFAGDIYQVNLSQRFMIKSNLSPRDLFQRLNRINPAPFAAFLQPGRNQYVISSSPERFLRVKNRRIETRPIKGTRPRGHDPARDRRLKSELRRSLKDNAELAMIVDLERNDLGRVSRYGTVRVTEPKTIETYPSVFHLVATVEGKLHPRYDLVDLIKATFPGGSITGAPKIRAMEIIDEFEPTQRNVYTGTIGYLGFDESLDLSIAIRIFLKNKRGTYFQAGGGIVADSDPASEYQETFDKVKGLIKALNLPK
ncbi:MAG: aminodeoxychorismate synthase component I [Planctomycetes bacterium]|nr:aminodeoxychorismate synthase component I [Planctomycetota bacterium]